MTNIFNTLLGYLATDSIDIDCVHLNPASMLPWDLRCTSLKRGIPNKAREKGVIDYDDAQLILYSDLSKGTLAKRRALSTLTKAFQESGLICFHYIFH